MSRILEKMKKLVGRLTLPEQDEFFEFVANLGEQEQPPNKPEATEPPIADQAVEQSPPTAESPQEPPVAEEQPTEVPPIAQAHTEPEPAPAPTTERPPTSEPDSPNDGEFYDGKVEDIPQMVKSEADDSAVYDANADSVEMHGSDSDSGDSACLEPPQEDTSGAEQGDIIAGLQAKITALEAENSQMKAKFGADFGYGNAPSMAKGRYQTRDDFIKSLPQIRKG